ncbi:hypothetical protein KFL_000390110 [Klebsormidium nitens]|uniref:Uncharacterized protein n=1 Tax=Klebsormidium nitens TaxID=105231 RepID=A0A1Y1HPW8_KLENI|nr:hypothetical protein KFL_000390110 [Klebsormidium nitens]|eukprot:GAQ79822.1 hypothetical protein KFL_000390110 [Klebsormidium nitens]
MWLLLLSFNPPVYGASEKFLSLPEPSLVNEFLLSTQCANWTNPVLVEQTQAPLQVIKCQSFTANGPRYDFYQVQTPSNAICEAPPPRIYITHHQSMALWDNKWPAIRAFVSLTVWNSVVVIVLGFILLVCTERPDPESDVRDSQRQSVELGVKSSSSPRSHSQDALDEAEACLSEVEGKSPHVATGQEEDSYASMARKGILIAFILGSLLAAYATPRAIRCSVQENRRTLWGPVGLPNPDRGLNQFMASASASAGKNVTSLKLCQTDKLNFYVGQVKTSCEQLGEPYAARTPFGDPIWQDLWTSSPFCLYLALSIGESTILLVSALVILVGFIKSQLTKGEGAPLVEEDLEKGEGDGWCCGGQAAKPAASASGTRDWRLRGADTRAYWIRSVDNVLELKGTVVLDPADIRFTKNSIEPVFSKGATASRLAQQSAPVASDTERTTVGEARNAEARNAAERFSSSVGGAARSYANAARASRGQPLTEVLELLRGGVMKVADLPPIRVVRHEDKWWSLDNRRLWVLKQLGRPISVQVVNDHKELFEKRTTIEMGWRWK